jgi:hypothetical protein
VGHTCQDDHRRGMVHEARGTTTREHAPSGGAPLRLVIAGELLQAAVIALPVLVAGRAPTGRVFQPASLAAVPLLVKEELVSINTEATK